MLPHHVYSACILLFFFFGDRASKPEAGAANVVAYKSWNLYASHVTGSTSNIAFRLEGYQQGEYGSETLKEACSLVFSFLVGAYACGILIDKNQVHLLGRP